MTRSPSGEEKQASGGLVDLEHVQGVVQELTRDDSSSWGRAFMVLGAAILGLLVIVLLAASVVGSSWTDFAEGTVEGDDWVASARAADDGATEIRVGTGWWPLAGRATVTRPHPGASVQAAQVQAGEHVFVFGLAAAHVDEIRVLANGDAVGCAALHPQTRPRQVFVVAVGEVSQDARLAVAGIDRRGDIIGPWPAE